MTGPVATEALVEAGCRAVYGKNWDGPADKAPGEAMRKVWRDLVAKAQAPLLAAHQQLTAERDEARAKLRSACLDALAAQDQAAENDERARAAEAELARLRERLEIAHAYDGAGNKIPFPEGMEHLDGIECRDETIRNLEEQIARLRAEIEANRALTDQIVVQMRKTMFVVFDLDGTLALTEHRAHFLNRPGREKDWRGFYAACDQDQPCHPIIRTLLALHYTGAEVEIWSGRSDEVKDKTTTWLAEHGLGHIPVRTRRVGDHRPDTVLKAEWMDEGRKPTLVFEDRASMVAMWRSRGIVCCQVAPGDF